MLLEKKHLTLPDFRPLVPVACFKRYDENGVKIPEMVDLQSTIAEIGNRTYHARDYLAQIEHSEEASVIIN